MPEPQSPAGVTMWHGLTSQFTFLLNRIPLFRTACCACNDYKNVQGATSWTGEVRPNRLSAASIKRALISVWFGRAVKAVGSDLFISWETTRLCCGHRAPAKAFSHPCRIKWKELLSGLINIKADDVILVRSGSQHPSNIKKKKKITRCRWTTLFWMCLCCVTTVWIFIWELSNCHFSRSFEASPNVSSSFGPQSQVLGCTASGRPSETRPVRVAT